MHHYVKPTMDLKPDVIVLHCGTNDLKKDNDAENIANNIMLLASKITESNQNTKVMLSSLTKRYDKFKDKAAHVNDHLKRICRENNIQLIDNGNINEKHIVANYT